MTRGSEDTVHSGQNRLSGRTADSVPARERAVTHVHARAERIKQRELEVAFTKLESEESLTEPQREAIVEMADTLIAELLAPPTRSLRNTHSSTRLDVRIAQELFETNSFPREEQRSG